MENIIETNESKEASSQINFEENDQMAKDLYVQFLIYEEYINLLKRVYVAFFASLIIIDIYLSRDSIMTFMIETIVIVLIAKMFYLKLFLQLYKLSCKVSSNIKENNSLLKRMVQGVKKDIYLNALKSNTKVKNVSDPVTDRYWSALTNGEIGTVDFTSNVKLIVEEIEINREINDMIIIRDKEKEKNISIVKE